MTDKSVTFYVASYQEILLNDNRCSNPPRKWRVWRILWRNLVIFWKSLVATWGFLNWEGELCLLVPWPHLSLRYRNWRLYHFFWNSYLMWRKNNQKFELWSNKCKNKYSILQDYLLLMYFETRCSNTCPHVGMPSHPLCTTYIWT